MKKVTIRTISFVLMIALCFSIVVPALAVGEDKEIFNQSLYENQISEDMAILDEHTYFITSEKLTPIDVVDGKIIYEMIVGSKIAYITVEEDSLGIVHLRITEDGKVNELQYQSDGRILVNEKEVVLPKGDRFNGVNDKDVAPYTYFSEKPMYGSASDYKNYTGTNEIAEVQFQFPWSEATESAVTELLAAALEVVLPGMGQAAGALVAVSEWAIMVGATVIPNELASMSYRYKTYVPDTQPGLSRHWKLDFTFYAQKNFAGSYYNKTLYENYYFG